MTEIICFDMDNTLVRSNKLHIYAFKKAFSKFKLPKKTTKEIIKTFSLESTVLVRELYPHLTKAEAIKIVKEHDKIVQREAKNHITVIRGAKGTLKKLKKHYKIAILSNCKHKEIQAILKAAKIDRKMFDLIIGNDDVKRPKPSPDEIFKAKRLLHIKKGYMVGDSIYDVRAGNKAKLKTIAVLTGNHSRYQLKKEKPWKILNSVADIPKTILKH